MIPFLKGLALLVALCCLVWVGMLWYWQSTQHDMSVNDVLLYLGVLPLTLFALVLLGGWAVRGAAAKGDAVAQAKVAVAAAPVAAPAAPSRDEAARHATWQLLAAHGNTSIGVGADEWLAAAEANQPMPSLDKELRDDAGLPVMTARVADLDSAALLDELEPFQEAVQPLHPDLTLSASFLRALALLREPLAAAVADLAPWAETLATPRPATARSSANADTAMPLADARVAVLVAWPGGLNAFESEIARQWLLDRLEQAGEGLVASARWSVLPSVADPAEPASASLAGPRLWQLADAWFEAQRRDERLDALLLMAAYSAIAPDALDRLQSQHRLFGTGNPKGTIPGEAAAVVLLAPAAWPADAESDKPVPHLHRAAVAQRDKSIDAARRSTHDLLRQLVVQAASAANLAPEALKAVVNDADQHTPRSAELFGAMLDELPKLDATEDMRMFGQLCGHIGACSTLMTVAVAAHQASQSEQPCLALSLGDAQWRAALVALPSAPPPAEASPPQASSAPPAPGAA